MSINKQIAEKCKEFNNVLSHLMEQVKNYVSPSNIMMLKSYMMVSIMGPVEQFMSYAEPHKDKIINRDESYFNNELNYKNNENLSKNESVMNEFLRLKDVYATLDEKSKKNLWDMMNALLIVGEEYEELKQKK